MGEGKACQSLFAMLRPSRAPTVDFICFNYGSRERVTLLTVLSQVYRIDSFGMRGIYRIRCCLSIVDYGPPHIRLPRGLGSPIGRPLGIRAEMFV